MLPLIQSTNQSYILSWAKQHTYLKDHEREEQVRPGLDS